MTPFYDDPLVTLYLGDCLEVMRELPDASVDAVVTDPPAGIGFMGKSWDHHLGGRDAWVAWMTGVMQECYRVLKPGGHILVWALPRTSHWTGWAIESAGFQPRDKCVHIFASGFPKSHNLPGGFGTALKPAHEDWWLARKPLIGSVAQNVTRYGTGALNIDGSRIGTTVETWPSSRSYAPGQIQPGGVGETMATGPAPAGRWPSNILLSDPELFDEPNPYVVGSGAVTSSGSRTGEYGGSESWTGPYGSVDRALDGDSGGYSRFFLIPKADRAERERGLAGRPTRYAGVAIRQAEPGEYDEFVHEPPEGIGEWLRSERIRAGLKQKDVASYFPSKTGGMTGCVANWELELNRPTPDQWRTLRQVIGFDKRYDEVMTTTRSVDRRLMDGAEPAQRANVHPTVKPIDLMRHLVKLVTPPGGVCLDPFLGSGTTALAASELGVRCIGIEREAEYLEIAKGRLMATPMGLGLVDGDAA